MEKKELLILYKTTSFGGTDGRSYEEQYFTNIEDAKNEALTNDWNTFYTLYEVKISASEKGKVTLKPKFISRIPCYSDLHKDNSKGTK